MFCSNSDELYLVLIRTRAVSMAVEGGLTRLNSNEVVMLSLLCLRLIMFCFVVS